MKENRFLLSADALPIGIAILGIGCTVLADRGIVPGLFIFLTVLAWVGMIGLFGVGLVTGRWRLSVSAILATLVYVALATALVDQIRI